MSRGATTTSCHTISTARVTDPKTWANILDYMAHNEKYAVSSKDQIHATPARADYYVIKIRREKLRSLIQAELRSAIETAQQEEMRNMSRNLAEKTLCDVFTTRYWAVTDGIEDSSFSFLDCVVT